MLQLIIAVLIFFVLLFGLGFIMNMLLKTTWLPTFIFVLVVVPLYVYSQWDSGSLWEHIKGYAWPDYLTALGGLAGAILSGAAIKTLRQKGYKMF